jgi:cell division protein FtsZ
MTLNLKIPQMNHTDFSPRITVIGVGGGGCNAVNNMIAANLQGVEFVVANTDAQQLMHSHADRRIQLGSHITQGLGAGAKPEIGRAAAEEASDELYRHLDGAHMVFITAGMGGGTGTGAAPVIARMARERNILTVGVVTKPFGFEGVRRARSADQGIEELQQYVDTLIVIPNQNLFRMANERTTWRDAFRMADQVLYMGVRGVTDLMMVHGLVNLDFADIRTVMAEMGKAMMGTGEAEGENRAILAAEAAINNPLLEDTSMSGARGLLINITGGEDLTLFEVDQAANRIREEVDEEANVIFGSAVDISLDGKIRVSVLATGIDSFKQSEARPRLVVVGGGAASAPIVMRGDVAAAAAAPAPAVLRQSSLQPQAPRRREPEVQEWEPKEAAAYYAAGIPLEKYQPQPASMSAEPTGLEIPAFLRRQSSQRPTDATGPTADTSPDDAPKSAVQVPAVLRQISPQSEVAASGVMAEPLRRMAQPQSSSTPVANPGRKSLFNAVTGAFRRRATAMPTQTPVAHAVPMRWEPEVEEYQPQPAPASVELASAEPTGLELPAFLRRQSSQRPTDATNPTTDTSSDYIPKKVSSRRTADVLAGRYRVDSIDEADIDKGYNPDASMPPSIFKGLGPVSLIEEWDFFENCSASSRRVANILIGK